MWRGTSKSSVCPEELSAKPAKPPPSSHTHKGTETYGQAPPRQRKPTQGHHSNLRASQNQERGAGREVGRCQWDNLGGGCWPVLLPPSSRAAGAVWQREGRGWQPLRRSLPITSTRAWVRRGRAGPAACAAPRPSTGPPRSGWPRAGCPGSGASRRPSSSSPAPRALGTERA